MNPERLVLLRLLEKMSEKYPDMRFGQLVANIASFTNWENRGVIWDVTDSELIKACEHSLSDTPHK